MVTGIKFCCLCDKRGVDEPCEGVEAEYGEYSTRWICAYHAKRISEEAPELVERLRKKGMRIYREESDNPKYYRRRNMDDRERNIRIDYHLVQAERWISHKDDTGLYHAVQEILEAIKLLAKSQ
jgi:hypothetical protein